MTDTVSQATRSRIMAAVKSKHTSPEMAVRRLLHSVGYRYRLHYPELPGSPDLAFPRRRKVIFVHGCFWHRHRCKYGRATPKSNFDYWQSKFLRNKLRDKRNQEELHKLGWQSFVVWECWTQDSNTLKDRLVTFLDDNDESAR